MKKVFLILTVIGMLVALCGCQENQPDTTDAKALSEMTDYELLCRMAEENAIHNWALSSYREYEDPLEDLARVSAEFAELMNRETAADSVQNYADALETEYPNCMISWILPYFD